MLKKLLLAVLLLPVATLVLAHEGGPHPGDDNPGTTYIPKAFFFGDMGDGGDDCFAAADFCAEVLQDPLVPAFDGLKGKERREAQALAADYSALACATASSYAAASYQWWFFGGGTLELARHGNHGAMHHITFDAALESGTLAFATASAEASASANAGAVASAEVSDSMDDLCTVVFADPELPEDHPAVQLCLSWEAGAFAYADAYANAGAFAASSSLSESGSFGAVSNYTEVWAANIEKFVSVATTAAGSFSYADASAVAGVFAEAFAYAYAQAFIAACAELNDGGDTVYAEICSDGWDDVDEAYAHAYASAYAEAQATAWANTSVAAILPVTYINENGIEDTILWGPDASWVAGGDVAVSCSALAEAVADGEAGD